MALSEPDLPGIAERIAADIRARLRARMAAEVQETLLDPDNLKSAHTIDDEANRIARRAFEGANCNIRIEGEPADTDPDAEFCVYIDPVDGSLNWDRGVGDPGFVLAVARGARAERLDDLEFGYLEGLRSGDRYWTADRRALYRSALTGQEMTLRCAAPNTVARATGYLRCGYGGARRQLERTLHLFLQARDLRAIDNAGTEVAEIARNAAHFLVEARGISDGYNLLAWPILRAAGGVVTDLDGTALGPRPFEPQAPVDFVAAGSQRLADDILEHLSKAADSASACIEALLLHGSGHDAPSRS